MKIIIGKNDSGKTRTLIKQSLDLGIPILALYDSKADSLRSKSLSYFGKIVHVVTLQDLADGSYSGSILVDDIEKAFATLLAAYLHSSDFNIVAATITEE